MVVGDLITLTPTFLKLAQPLATVSHVFTPLCLHSMGPYGELAFRVLPSLQLTHPTQVRSTLRLVFNNPDSNNSPVEAHVVPSCSFVLYGSRVAVRPGPLGL